MKKLSLRFVFAALIASVFLSCAKVPADELGGAEEAWLFAQAMGASRLFPKEWRELSTRRDELGSEVKAHSKRFFRTYGTAKLLAGKLSEDAIYLAKRSAAETRRLDEANRQTESSMLGEEWLARVRQAKSTPRGNGRAEAPVLHYEEDDDPNRLGITYFQLFPFIGAKDPASAKSMVLISPRNVRCNTTVSGLSVYQRIEEVSIISLSEKTTLAKRRFEGSIPYGSVIVAHGAQAAFGNPPDSAAVNAFIESYYASKDDIFLPFASASSFAFLPEGNDYLVVSGGSESPRRLSLRKSERETGKLLLAFSFGTGDDEGNFSVEASGRYLQTLSDNGNEPGSKTSGFFVGLYSLSDGGKIGSARLLGEDYAFNKLSLPSPREGIVLLGAEKRASVRDLTKPGSQPLALFECDPYTAVFSPDGAWVYAYDDVKRKVLAVDASTGVEGASFAIPETIRHRFWSEKLKFGELRCFADGRLLLVLTREFASPSIEKILPGASAIILGGKDLAKLAEFPAPAGLTLTALSPDGSRAASFFEPGEAVLWSAVDGRELRRFTAHRGNSSDFSLSFSADGTTLALRADRSLKLIDLDE